MWALCLIAKWRFWVCQLMFHSLLWYFNKVTNPAVHLRQWRYNRYLTCRVSLSALAPAEVEKSKSVVAVLFVIVGVCDLLLRRRSGNERVGWNSANVTEWQLLTLLRTMSEEIVGAYVVYWSFVFCSWLSRRSDLTYRPNASLCIIVSYRTIR